MWLVVVGRQGQDVNEQDRQVCKVERWEGSMEVRAEKKGQRKKNPKGQQLEKVNCGTMLVN